MKKQISLILCALIIATGFAGCGKKSKDKLTESKADTQSKTEVDTIDVGGESEDIPTVDLETGSIISGGKTEKGTNKSDKTDKTVATEDDIPAKGETGTSKEESKESTPTSTAPSSPSSTDKPTGSETSGTSSNSDTQTMDGWGKWQY